MLPGRPRIFFSQISRAGLAGILLLLVPFQLLADHSGSNIVCREDLSQSHREQLTIDLRKITGLSDLEFQDNGTLLASANQVAGGSKTARDLILKAMVGRNAVVLEDVSNSSDVAFARVIPGKWKKASAANPPAFVVQMDFADFDRLIGDTRALEAFNIGWGFLHELDHIVNDSADATSDGETGECEAHLNQMRRECNLPQRADYFYTLLPLSTDTSTMTKLVRLAFDQEHATAKKKKRYWVLWDANVVGGLDGRKQSASLR
jgi:hypothetical protein